MANELIVRFKQSAINKDAIDDKISTRKAEFGDLSYYLTSSADSTIRESLSDLCSANTLTSSNSNCVINAVKIFKKLKTTDTTTVSRMGETIKIPDFWTTLLLVFPNGINIDDVYERFSNLHNIIAYSEANLIVDLCSTANDIEYVNQKSLYPSPSFTNADWARPSSSNILESTIGDSLLPRERVKINSCSTTTCDMSGYVYQVFDLANNPLGWWPFDTTLSNSNFEYTLLTHNKLAPNSITDELKSKLGAKVYPNPSFNEQTIIIETTKEDDLIIKIFDISGRELKKVYSGKSTDSNTTIKTDISFLSSGIYVYEVILGSEIKRMKFAKY